MRRLVSLVAVLGMATAAFGQLSYSTVGGSYSQNFDSLANTGTGNVWANDSTLPGWFLFRQPAPGTAITTYNANDGSSNTGNFYSYGSANSSERALGGLGSGGAYFGSPAAGAVAGWIAFGVRNDTGVTLSQFNVSFNGEQWRDGGTATTGSVAQPMILEYGFGASFTTVATWTAPGGSFDWSSPVFGATSGVAVDGNAAGLVPGRGGAIGSLTWAPGAVLWIRWIELNDFSNDHALAIDDFSFRAIPEPATLCLLGLGSLLLRRRKA